MCLQSKYSCLNKFSNMEKKLIYWTKNGYQRQRTKNWTKVLVGDDKNSALVPISLSMSFFVSVKTYLNAIYIFGQDNRAWSTTHFHIMEYKVKLLLLSVSFSKNFWLICIRWPYLALNSTVVSISLQVTTCHSSNVHQYNLSIPRVV